MYRECRLLQLPVLVGNGAACSLCVAMLEELGQNGNDILLQFVGCSIIKYFAVCWFRHFAKRIMLLHSLPVKYLYTL